MIVFGVLLIAVGAVGMIYLYSEKRGKIGQQLQSKAAIFSAGPHVLVTKAEHAPPVQELTLIGETVPFETATVYARASGYLKSINVDKGDHVQKDQILGTIESPEIDKTYQAYLADWVNKSRIAKRMRVLEAKKLISPQEAELTYANEKISRGTLQAQAVLKDFEVVRAPLEGTVTARFVDPGAMIQNGSNSPTASALVTISHTQVLRCYIYLSQRDAAFVRVGTPVRIEHYDRPGIQLTAKIVRMSGQLDPSTRTLLTEVDFENPDNWVVAGSFVKVSLSVQEPPALIVPVDALVSVQGAPMVALVTPDDSNKSGKVEFRKIEVAENNGMEIRITSGLNPGDLVVLNVGSNISSGQRVQISMPTQAAGRVGK